MALQKVLRTWSAAMPPRQQVAGASTSIRRTYAHNTACGQLALLCKYMGTQALYMQYGFLMGSAHLAI